MKTFAAALASIVLLAGCSSSDSAGSDGGTQATPTTASPSASKGTGATVDIAIAGGKVTPQGERVQVRVGDTVTLHVASDADEELHVHSDPEHTFEVAKGDDTTFDFTVDVPGQIAVEAHHLDVTIAQLVVRP
jgi:plastocyanin